MPSRWHVGVFGHLVSLLDFVEGDLEVLVINTADHVAVHVDQTTVGVVSESLLAGGVGKADDRFVVQDPGSKWCSSCRAWIRQHRSEPRPTTASWYRRTFLPSSFSQHGDVLLDAVHQV